MQPRFGNPGVYLTLVPPAHTGEESVSVHLNPEDIRLLVVALTNVAAQVTE